MRLKTVISGILSSLGCYLALMRLAYDTLPAQLIPNWSTPLWDGLLQDEWVKIIVYGFAALSLLVGGWLSASWNKARNRKESLRFGASAGLIAGALSFDLVGAAWAGLLGQSEILKNANITLTEAEGGEILLNAIIETAQRTYGMIWEFIIPSILLGALGGLIFALELKPEEKPAHPQKSGWLFRLSAFTLVISGVFSAIIMFAVLILFPEILTDMAIDFNLTPTIPPELLITFASLSTALAIGLPLLLTWVWVFRRWKTYKKERSLSIVWLLITFAPASYYAFKALYSLFNLGLVNFGAIILIVIIGAFLLMWFISSEPTQEARRHTLADWIGYALTQGVLGGTQFFAGIAAFSLSLVLISVTNIPHLMSVPSEVVETPLVEQIDLLFKTQQSGSLAIIGAMTVIALLLGVITVFLRWATGINQRRVDADSF